MSVSGSRLAGLGDQLDLGDTVGQLQGGLERIGETPFEPLSQHQTVDDDLDLVLLVASQALVALEELVDHHDLAVDSGTDVSLTAEVGEQRVVLALAAAHDRRQHLEPGALVEFEDAIDDLLRRLALQPGSVCWGSAGCRPGRRADAGSRRPR